MRTSQNYLNKNFWNKKNILITGVNGFIGSNLVNHLLSKGAIIHGISDKTEKNIVLRYNNTLHKINFHKTSLTNKNKINDIIKSNDIEICYHLAAQVDVNIARKNPIDTFDSNIRGTYTLLECLRNSKKIKSIIVASSDKAYGDYPLSKLPYKEEYDLRPRYPYDVSKACGDFISHCYSSEIYKLPIITTRFSNIYGPGQLNFSALIPDCILALMNLKTFKLRSNGKNKRDYLFVDDVCELYLCLGYNLYKNNKLSGEIFNAGTGTGYTVDTIIKNICSIENNKSLYKKIKSQYNKKKSIGEIENQFMSYSKLNKYFGWSPKYQLNNGLYMTIMWYKEIFNKYGKNKMLRNLIK